MFVMQKFSSNIRIRMIMGLTIAKFEQNVIQSHLAQKFSRHEIETCIIVLIKYIKI